MSAAESPAAHVPAPIDDGSSSSSSSGGGGRSGGKESQWTAGVPPQTPPRAAGSDQTPTAAALVAEQQQQQQQQKEDVLLALPFLFVPFLTPRDCLALASTSTALAPYHHHVHLLCLRPPTATHPHEHHAGLRRLMQRLARGVRTLQLRPHKAGQAEDALLQVVGDMLASGILASSLTTLDVAHFPLRSVGAATLAAALAGGGCANLLRLDLSHTEIEDTDIVEMAKALSNGQSSALALLPPTTPASASAASSATTAALPSTPANPHLFVPATAHTAAGAAGMATPAVIGVPLPRPVPPPSSTPHYSPLPAACPRLQSLSLAGTGLTDAGLIALADVLPRGCPHLHTLDLSGTAASAAGWTRGVAELMGPQGLTELRRILLPRAGSAGGQALRSVARALAAGGALCLGELDCGGLCITDGGVHELAHALRRRREIVVGGADPAAAGGGGVRRHAPLRRLVLTGGCVGPSGLGALLGEVTAPDNDVQHLDLSGSLLTGGAATLGVLLRFLRDGAGPGGLQTLGLARCGLGASDVQAVGAAVAEGGCRVRVNVRAA